MNLKSQKTNFELLKIILRKLFKGILREIFNKLKNTVHN